MDNIMRALVWNNPYGALMFFGKTKETRMYPTNIRGEVLVCTAKKPFNCWKVDSISGDRQATRMVSALDIHAILEGKGRGSMQSKTNRYVNLNGFAIGVVTIVDCHLMKREDEDATFVKYDPKRWCWVTENQRLIEPFEWKFGKQGWLLVPCSELPKIKYL